MDSKGTQPYIYMYLCSPEFPSHPACHITLGRLPCVYWSLLVICFTCCHFCPLLLSTTTVPISFLFLGPPCSLRYNNVETRPGNNLHWPLSSQRKGRVTCLSLLNLKLHRIKLTEKGMLKATTGQKQGLLQQ